MTPTDHFEHSFLKATETLEHIFLDYFELTGGHWDLFIEALQCKPKISKLSMQGCKFDADASQGFVDWMSDSTKNNVRELYLRPQSNDLLDSGIPFGRGIAKALVNSRLDVFHFPGDEMDIDQEGFFEEIKLNSDLIRLHSLQTDYLNNNNPAAACVDYLSATTSLRKFTITNISSYIPSMAFMYAD
jgi:hypothetical protein